MNRTRLCIASLSLGVLVVASGYGVVIAHRFARLQALAREELVLRAHMSAQAALRSGPASSVAPSDSDSGAALLQCLTHDLDVLNVRGRSLTTGPVAAHGAGDAMQIRLMFSSSTAAVFELLRKFESYERQVWVEELVIARPAGAELDGLSVKIHLATCADSLGVP